MKISKRMKLAVIAFLIVFFLLLLRLAEIQLFFTESFSKKKINLIQESVKQRTEEVLIWPILRQQKREQNNRRLALSCQRPPVSI